MDAAVAQTLRLLVPHWRRQAEVSLVRQLSQSAAPWLWHLSEEMCFDPAVQTYGIAAIIISATVLEYGTVLKAT